MKHRYLVATTLLSLAFIVGNAIACSSGDKTRALGQVAANAGMLLHHQAFKELDKLVAQYRQPDSFASDGQPNLMGFYDGLALGDGHCVPSGPNPELDLHEAWLRQWQAGRHARGAPELALAMLELTRAITPQHEGMRPNDTLRRAGMAKSEAMLGKIREIAAIEPQWYEAMLILALSRHQNWTPARFDALFEEAVKAHPYYLDYYFTKGAFYSDTLRDSPDSFASFVEDTVNQTKEKMGQTMYARLHWSAGEPSMFENGRTDWPRMKTGFEDLLRAYPDSWNRNNFAMFACMAGDYRTVKMQYVLSREFVLQAWQRFSDNAWFYGECLEKAGINVNGPSFVPQRDAPRPPG